MTDPRRKKVIVTAHLLDPEHLGSDDRQPLLNRCTRHLGRSGGLSVRSIARHFTIKGPIAQPSHPSEKLKRAKVELNGCM
jgi:hypothetical protein